MNIQKCFVCLLLVMAATRANATPAVPGLKVSTCFGDHMVLQRGKAVPIWGWASAGSKVSVKFAGQEHSATTNKEGRWIVELSPITTNAQGQTLTITQGSNTLEFKDILVGEVWICSGQSNMAYTMGRAGKNMPEGFDPSKYSMIRQFKARKQKKKDFDPIDVGKWSVCSADTVKGFTAAGFFFARKLTEELNVPVGLLNCSKGSTRVEWWQVKSVKMFRMIRQILPQAIRGAIWYQGEHNAGGPKGYGEKLKELIDGWRKEFNQGDFPFYIVQLPNFRPANPNAAGGDGWAIIREEQLSVTRTTANTGIAVITDTAKGPEGSAHPDNKVDCGIRLALLALAKDYGKKDLVYSGPIFKEMRIKGNKAILSFDCVGSGFMVARKEGLLPPKEIKDGVLGGFAIAGDDKKWYWADAQIEGQQIIVTSKDVPTPAAVRYAFRGNPVNANLYNREGLPAGQFRTDTWEIPDETFRWYWIEKAKEKAEPAKNEEKKLGSVTLRGAPLVNRFGDGFQVL